MTSKRAEFLLPTTAINRAYGVGWKYLRRFYLSPSRGGVKCWRQNRDWGRAWLVNVKSSTPGQKEGIFSYRRLKVFHNLYFHVHQEQHKQILWWYHWLGNMIGIKMSLERNWFRLYLPRNLKQKVLRSSVPFGPPWFAEARNAVRPEACYSPCYKLHSDTKTQWVGTYTLCYRIMKYPCLMFEVRT